MSGDGTQRDLTDLLRLTQWLSPAFPLGSFAYSHGLETAISRGELRNADNLAYWLDAILERGSGRADALLLSLAHRRVLDDSDLVALAAALAASRERWEETIAQGEAFVRTTNAILGTGLATCPLPVAVGIQARRLKLATEQVLALYLQAFTVNLVTVATRLVPLGQTEAQCAQDRLGPRITALAHELAGAGPEAFSSAAPRAEIAAMAHETAELRLFRS